MRIMVRTEEIMELVGVDILIHRNREDILLRCFIMRREIECIILTLANIAFFSQFIAIIDAGFPGIQLLVSTYRHCAERHQLPAQQK